MRISDWSSDMCSSDLQIEGFGDMGGRQDARAGLFVDDDALVLPQLPRELVGAAVDRIDARRAAAEQHVGEPPGRRPAIDRHPPRPLPAEIVPPVPAPAPPPPHPRLTAPPPHHPPPP